MDRAGTPPQVASVRRALLASQAVRSVTLVGSRSDGRATELSDWDLLLDGDPRQLMDELPRLVGPLNPLAAFWEPLSERAALMMVLDGPIKVDLFVQGGRRPLSPPWQPSTGTLPDIDGHFWDWLLWLGGKSLRQERRLVADELTKMHWFLLGPLGVVDPPSSLNEAVGGYRQARTAMCERLGLQLDPELGIQVVRALRQHHLVT